MWTKDRGILFGPPCICQPPRSTQPSTLHGGLYGKMSVVYRRRICGHNGRQNNEPTKTNTMAA